jgi:hypothetical protein
VTDAYKRVLFWRSGLQISLVSSFKFFLMLEHFSLPAYNFNLTHFHLVISPAAFSLLSFDLSRFDIPCAGSSQILTSLSSFFAWHFHSPLVPLSSTTDHNN